MLRNIFWFFAGVAFTGLLLDRGINLPQRISDAIDWGKLEQLGQDVWDSAKQQNETKPKKYSPKSFQDYKDK